MTAYGLDNINPDRDISISLIEASNRLLPALPKRMSYSVENELKKLNVNLYDVGGSAADLISDLSAIKIH